MWCKWIEVYREDLWSLKCKKFPSTDHVTEVFSGITSLLSSLNFQHKSHICTDSFQVHMIHISSKVLQKNMWKISKAIELGTVIKVKSFLTSMHTNSFDRDELTFHCKNFSLKLFFIISLLRFQILLLLISTFFLFLHHWTFFKLWIFLPSLWALDGGTEIYLFFLYLLHFDYF